MAKRKKGRAKVAGTESNGNGSKNKTPKTAGKAQGSTFDVKALRTKIGASREVFGKLVGVSSASVLNWETKSAPKPENIAKLKDVEKRFDAGDLQVPKTRGPGRPPRSATTPATTGSKKAGRPAKVASEASMSSAEVSRLRASLGLSRAKFAKKIGASTGSVQNWETGKSTPRASYVTKLRGLMTSAGNATTASAPTVAPKRRGRPPKAGVTGNGSIPADRLGLAETMLRVARTCSPSTAQKLMAAAGALLSEQ